MSFYAIGGMAAEANAAAKIDVIQSVTEAVTTPTPHTSLLYAVITVVVLQAKFTAPIPS